MSLACPGRLNHGEPGHDAVEDDDADRLELVALRPKVELAKPGKDITAGYLIPFNNAIL